MLQLWTDQKQYVCYGTRQKNSHASAQKQTVILAHSAVVDSSHFQNKGLAQEP